MKVNSLFKGVKHSGNTPLHLATVAAALRKAKTPEDDNSCVSELLERGAEANAANSAGVTPLHEACRTGSERLVDLLLRHGADVNKRSDAGESCLFSFLDHRANVGKRSLLVKLLALTSPLAFSDHAGQLPSTLTLPCFREQREQLLKLALQPRRLQDICKKDIYLKYVRDKGEEVRKILPQKLYDFVFNQWENSHISFLIDSEQDSDTAPIS